MPPILRPLPEQRLLCYQLGRINPLRVGFSLKAGCATELPECPLNRGDRSVLQRSGPFSINWGFVLPFVCGMMLLDGREADYFDGRNQ